MADNLIANINKCEQINRITELSKTQDSPSTSAATAAAPINYKSVTCVKTHQPNCISAKYFGVNFNNNSDRSVLW